MTKGVVVHCWGGRGRTRTVLGCVIREPGYEGETVVKYLGEIQRVRGRKGWPEAVWQLEIVRKWPDVREEPELLESWTLEEIQ